MGRTAALSRPVSCAFSGSTPSRRSERRGEASQGEHPPFLERASFRGGARAPEIPGLGECGAGLGAVLGGAAGVADERPGVALKPPSPFLLPFGARGHGKGQLRQLQRLLRALRRGPLALVTQELRQSPTLGGARRELDRPPPPGSRQACHHFPELLRL